MEKGFAFLTTAVVGSCAALVAIACGDSESSTFPGEGADASTDSPPGFVIDSGGSSSGGSSGEGGTAAKCDPVIENGYKANWTAPAAPATPGPCTDTLLGTYYAECATTVGAPDHKTRCDAWKAANAACGACIEPTNNSGPIQWHQNRQYYTLNVAGCIAISQGNKFAESECGYAYGAAVNCERDACGGCFQTGNSTFDQFRQCQQKAQNVGLCKSLEVQQSTVCVDVTTKAETKPCFNENGAEQPQVHYTRVMKIFCGL